jgi:hypothetical protein
VRWHVFTLLSHRMLWLTGMCCIKAPVAAPAAFASLAVMMIQMRDGFGNTNSVVCSTAARPRSSS